MPDTWTPLRGVVAPLLTPFNDDGRIATDLYIGHAERLLADGCVGLAPFGTTGEALSIGIDERRRQLEALVAAGLDARQLVPGTGLTNLPDTIGLTRHAHDLGCHALLLLPPFYVKDPPDDGLSAYFDDLVAATGDEARLLLYHIPQVAGVGFSPELVGRLHESHPTRIVGIKDSSGDWSNTQRLFAVDGLAVYPGSEIPLLDALAAGGPGCISATANVNARGIAELVRAVDNGDRAGVHARHVAVVATRTVFQEHGLISAQKFWLARETGDRRWRNVRPPLQPMVDAAGARLLEALAER